MAQDKQQPKEVKAYARYIHVSPRKLRLVADLVRRTGVDEALEQLKFSAKNAAIPLSKTINSAIANAVHNFNLNKEDLFIKSITIDGGPVFKRYVPRAQGRAFIERKRTSHINVVLEARPKPGKRSRSIFALRPRSAVVPGSADADADKEGKIENNEVQKGKIMPAKVKPKTAGKSREKIKKHLVDLKRRLFNRKSGQ